MWVDYWGKKVFGGLLGVKRGWIIGGKKGVKRYLV